MSGQFVLQLGSVESAAAPPPRRTSRGMKKSTKKRAADEEAAEKASRASSKKKQKSGEARSAAATATAQASAAAIAEELPQPECAPTVATSTADGTDTSSTSVPVAALIEKDGIDIFRAAPLAQHYLNVGACDDGGHEEAQPAPRDEARVDDAGADRVALGAPEVVEALARRDVDGADDELGSDGHRRARHPA